MLEIMLLLFF